MGVKSGRPIGLTPCRHLRAECVKMWEPQTLVTLRTFTSCKGITVQLYSEIGVKISAYGQQSVSCHEEENVSDNSSMQHDTWAKSGAE
jgi:hypothetical protein